MRSVSGDKHFDNRSVLAGASELGYNVRAQRLKTITEDSLISVVNQFEQSSTASFRDASKGWLKFHGRLLWLTDLRSLEEGRARSAREHLTGASSSRR